MNGFFKTAGVLGLTLLFTSCGKPSRTNAKLASTALGSNPFYEGETTAEVLAAESTGDGGTIGGGNPNPGGGDGGTLPNPSATPTPSPSASPAPSATPNPSPSSSPSPTVTPEPSASPLPSTTPAPTPSPTPDPGDGGSVPTPTPSPNPGDGGTTPTPSATPTPSTCPAPNPKTDAGFVRVCSQMRSGIKDFIFFEEAKNPILTVEHLYQVKNTKTKKNETKRLVLAYVNLSQVNLLANPKPLVPVDPNLSLLKDIYSKDTWKDKTLTASICEDKKNSGTCSDKTGYDLLSIETLSFRADRIPSHLSFEVWSGRSLLLSKNPQLCEKQYSPLVLDLKGDGIRLSGPGTGVLFDLDDTGIAVRTGWVNRPDDAFLVRDINQNGRIDSGAELFGSATRLPNGSRAANGFEALKALDANQDGAFTPEDPVWNEVNLWLDRNLNGLSEADEIVSLRSAGVVSIDLNYVNIEHLDRYGNATKQRSTFIRRANHTTKRQLIIDVWFNTLIPH